MATIRGRSPGKLWHKTLRTHLGNVLAETCRPYSVDASDFQEIPSNYYLSLEMDPGCIGPHLVGYLGVVLRHEVRQHKGLDTSGLSDTASLSG